MRGKHAQQEEPAHIVECTALLDAQAAIPIVNQPLVQRQVVVGGVIRVQFSEPIHHVACHRYKRWVPAGVQVKNLGLWHAHCTFVKTHCSLALLCRTKAVS